MPLQYKYLEKIEKHAGLLGALIAIMVCVGFFLGLVVMHMPMASLLVMLFLLARVANYLSKSQRAFQQVAMRDSAYWSIAGAIEAARAQREPAGGSGMIWFTFFAPGQLSHTSELTARPGRAASSSGRAKVYCT